MKRFFFISFLIVQFSFSQDLIHYSTENGLPHDVTYQIYFDKLGYMWLGTDNGLVKFNGKEFKIYSDSDGLASNFVMDIKEVSKDTMIIATWGEGLHYFSNERFTKFNEEDRAKLYELTVFKDDVYSYNSSRNIKYLKDKGQRKISSFVFDSLLNYSTKGYNTYRFSTKLVSVEDQLLVHNRLMKDLGFKSFKGVYVLQENKLRERFTFLKDKKVDAILKFNNLLYACSVGDSILFFDEREIVDSRKLDISNEVILKIIRFSDDIIYILASNKKGFKNAYKYFLKNNSIINLRDKYNIKSTISDIAIDFEKNIWLSTYGEGLYQIPFNTIKVNTLLKDEEVTKIISFQDNIYGLNPNAVFEFKKRRLTQNYLLNGFGKNISEVEKNLIVSSVKLDSNSVEITDFIEEKKGVFFYKDDKVEISLKDSLMINHDSYLGKPKTINKLFYDDGLYYLGTNSGLYFLDKNFKIHPTPYEVLRNIKITDIERQDDILWISTSKGLFRKEGEAIRKISIDDGLVSDNIKEILVSHDDKLWIATIKGLAVYDGESFVNITKTEKLPSNNINSILEDKDYNIWIASLKGVSLIDNKKKNLKQIPPILQVSQKDNRFDFDVISFSNANNLFTQYSINNQPWKKSTTKFLEFDNFKEGVYSFQLRSKKPNSDWQYSKLYSFRVKVPFFEKTGVITFVILVSSLLFLSLVYYRLTKIRKTNRLLTESIQKQKELEVKLTSVRKNIAEDFHDDLGNKLASITILTDILSKKIKTNDAKNLAEKILINTDSLYKGTRDFIWSLKNESDQLEEMVTYLSDFGEEFFHDLNIKFRIHKNIEKNIKLPYYWSRHLILIFKEAMTNAAKHSDCSEVVISFNFHHNILEIYFEDNGSGFDMRSIQIENGLKNITDRSKKIGGELTISSSKKGTKVTFKGKIS